MLSMDSKLFELRNHSILITFDNLMYKTKKVKILFINLVLFRNNQFLNYTFINLVRNVRKHSNTSMKTALDNEHLINKISYVMLLIKFKTIKLVTSYFKYI